jgi:hypothetical protein
MMSPGSRDSDTASSEKLGLVCRPIVNLQLLDVAFKHLSLTRPDAPIWDSPRWQELRYGD